MSGRGIAGGGPGGKRPGSPALSEARSDEPRADAAGRRRRTRSTLNDWPGTELTPPAKRPPTVPGASRARPDTRPPAPRKLDPARLAEVLPRPEDDDLLSLPERPPGEAPVSALVPPLFGKSRPGKDIGDLATLEHAPSGNFLDASALRGELTPVPGLPGEGPVSAGVDVGLDDAWTSDLGEWTAPTGPTREIERPALAGPAAPRSAEDEPRGEAAAGEPGPAIMEPAPELELVRPIVDESGDLPTTEFRVRPDGAAPASDAAADPLADLRRELDSYLGADDGGADDASAAAQEDEPLDDMARIARSLRAELDQDASPDEPPAERVRRRITWLIERSQSEFIQGHYDVAVVALDMGCDEDPESAVAQTLIQRHHDSLCEIYESYIGDTEATPELAVSLGEVAGTGMSSRAAFLLTRIDGVLTFEELLDVAGMPRIEALRYLSTLLLRGVLKKS